MIMGLQHVTALFFNLCPFRQGTFYRRILCRVQFRVRRSYHGRRRFRDCSGRQAFGHSYIHSDVPGEIGRLDGRRHQADNHRRGDTDIHRPRRYCGSGGEEADSGGSGDTDVPGKGCGRHCGSVQARCGGNG